MVLIIRISLRVVNTESNGGKLIHLLLYVGRSGKTENLQSVLFGILLNPKKRTEEFVFGERMLFRVL